MGQRLLIAFKGTIFKGYGVIIEKSFHGFITKLSWNCKNEGEREMLQVKPITKKMEDFNLIKEVYTEAFPGREGEPIFFIGQRKEREEKNSI